MEHFGEDFLHKKYAGLSTSSPVEHEVRRKENKGEKTSQKPADKIAYWLKVVERTHAGHHDDPRVLERIKEYYYQEHIIKPEDIPESVFLLEQRVARDLGYGTVEITDDFKEKKIQQIITDQTASLDRWIDYLSSSDATYPTWAKYWAFVSILEMGKFEKTEKEEGNEKKEFGRFVKRTKDTVASFPTLNPRALAMTVGVMQSRLEEKEKPKQEQKPIKNFSVKLDDSSFQQLLSTENFSKLYAQFLIEMPEYSTEGLQETRGAWVKYEQGSDPKPLVDSLVGYPLEWCTANIDTARTQLECGDFYVYYSINEFGEAIIPRVAIRMEGRGEHQRIGEVRGIAHHQNLDPYIGEVVQEQMAKFPDGQAYEKKAGDMNLLTVIEQKIKTNQELTKDELVFLYEMKFPIDGFGFETDPRIKELKKQRDSQKDALVILGYSSEQVAHSQKDISEDKKAYIGPLFPGIFSFKNLEHIYTSFPENKITIAGIKIGGKTEKELEKELRKQKVEVSKSAKSMLKSKDFSTAKKVESMDLVCLTLKDLGFTSGVHTDEIYERAEYFGLVVCPAEVALHIHLQQALLASDKWFYVAMKPIAPQNDYPSIFKLRRDLKNTWFNIDMTRVSPPVLRWNSLSCEFVFRLRPPTGEVGK